MEFRPPVARGQRLLGELTISQLVYRSMPYVRLGFGVLSGLLTIGAVSALFQGGGTYVASYLLICLGLLPPLALWVFSLKKNLPLVPVLALTTLIWNALPLALGNKQLTIFTEEEILRASSELLVFGVSLTFAYLIVAGSPTKRPTEYLGFAITNFESRRLVITAALVTLTGCVIIEYLMMTGWLVNFLFRLPQGTFSIVRVIQESAKMAVGFVLGYAIGGQYVTGTRKLYVIACFTMLLVLGLASLLLSSAAGMSLAIAAGLYLGSGRIPWKYMLVLVCVVAFFNYSKHEMRRKHWFRGIGPLQIHELPEYFVEWSGLTIDKFFADEYSRKKDSTQGLLERVSTLQMLLFVQRKVVSHQYTTLNGETYAMIPQLLVPRVLWPNKPRTHEGQVRLNTHFGRQNRAETFVTYIAWGLVAESYGNFGPMLGPLILGLFAGLLLSSIEAWSGNYPLLSIRGAMATAILLEVLISYEMTAAVLVTSTAQLLVVIGGSAIPLATRHRLVRTA
jgi:hypothetical protein